MVISGLALLFMDGFVNIVDKIESNRFVKSYIAMVAFSVLDEERRWLECESKSCDLDHIDQAFVRDGRLYQFTSTVQTG